MEEKVAIVTGSASGIGKAYADILLENNIKVSIVDVNGDLGKKTHEEFAQKYGEDQVIFIECDVSSNEQLADAFAKTIERFGRLDIVINNAGILRESNPQMTMSINLSAVLQGCFLGIKYMGTDNGGKGGVIINTASINGLYPDGLFPMYTASKYAIVGYTLSMGAVSPDIHGIRLNAVCPCCTATTLVAQLRDKGVLYGPDAQQQVDATLNNYQRPMSAREVAKAMWKLIEDETLSGRCMIVGAEGAFLATHLPKTYQEVLSMYTDYKA